MICTPMHIRQALLLPLALCWATMPCGAQSLDERLDEQRFLRGLADLQLPEVLDRYNESHPASDEIQRVDRKIVALKLSLHDLPNTIADRLPTVDAILAAREDILRTHADDPRRALWLIEQASDLYFLLLPMEGSGLTALFGVPSEAQREVARRAAAGIYQSAANAELAIEELLLDLESSPGFNTDFALQSSRRRVSQDERERRIPFFRGVGAFLQARLGDGDESTRRALLEQSAASLSRVAALLERDLAAQARAYGGMALAELGQHEKAMELFRAAATDPAAHATTMFTARMGAARSFVIHDGPEAALRGLDDIAPRYQAQADFFYRLLIADQRFLLYQGWSQREVGARKGQLARQSIQGYVALLPADDSPAADAMRQIVSARLARAGSAAELGAGLPALVSILQAERLSSDAATREQAIALLTDVLAQPGLSDDDRCAAMFALATANERAGRLHDAAELYHQLAKQFPADRQSAVACEQAARLAAEGRARGEVGWSDVLRSALDLILSQYPDLPSIDSWRIVRGQLALEESEFDDAQAVLERIGGSSPSWPQARFLLVSVMRGRMNAAAATSERLALARSMIAAARELEQQLDTRLQQASEPARHYMLRDLATRLGIMVAEAQIELGQPQDALATLDEVERTAARDGGHVAELLRTRIAARRAAGSGDSIQDEVNRLMELSPQLAGEVIASSLRSYRDEVESLLRDDRAAEAADLASSELLPLARSLDRWLDLSDPDEDRADSMSRLIADCYRLAGDWDDALRTYDRVSRIHPDALDVLFGQAECLFHLGGETNLAEAMKLYKRLSAARTDEADSYFWRSELRMLQILDQTGRNVQQIAPRIDRLRLRDAQLGGAQLRREFDRLRSTHDAHASHGAGS